MKINRELIKEYPWKMRWDARTSIIAKIIPEGVSVLDLGGGFCNLARHLGENRNNRYLSIDLKPYTDATVVGDFNKGEFPDVGKFHYLVVQGLIEYIKKPAEFLEAIKKYGSTLIITRNRQMTMAEFKKLLQDAGWEVIFSRPIRGTQKLFYCTKK